ncbi:hypothetical protein [Haemophilus influenzae]|uniref:hypothetical protein n=1 Tax=Haemophilus influenzae TaxID=727 RepID=UPI00058908D2|nr:hypothetical protein [Haemophilus influenzae]KIG22847.1 hypothetical protein W820_06620 [Haemophilus influenzae 60294N1]
MEEKKPLIKQWYTLDQAIEKLSKENVGDYSKNDLVHYWLNGFIEFYTTIFYNIESLQLGNIEIKNEDLLVFQFSGTGNIALELSKENKKALSKPIFGNTHLRIVQHLSELIEISSAFTTYGTNIKKQNILTDPENRLMMLVDGLIRIDRPFSFVDRIKIIDRINIYKIAHLFIDINEIYITHDELQKIYDLNEDGKINNKLKSRKSQNTQARFIRDLLAINYNLHTAQEIRGALDNPRSMISRQFDEKELIKPSGKTIYNYINQVED